MKSIPDLHVFVSWPFVFVETGNCKDNSSELITANKQRILGRSMHVFHRVTGYMSRSLLRRISELSCRFHHLSRP